MTHTRYIDDQHGPQWDPDQHINGILTQLRHLEEENTKLDQAIGDLASINKPLELLAYKISRMTRDWADTAADYTRRGYVTTEQTHQLLQLLKALDDNEHKTATASRALRRARRDRTLARSDYETLALETKDPQAATLWALLGIRDALLDLTDTARNQGKASPSAFDRWLNGQEGA